MGAPDPVHIHSGGCQRFQGPGFPPGLEGFPLLIEARTDDGRVLRADAVAGGLAADVIEAPLGDRRTDFVFLRHGEAGCYVAPADRA